MGGSSRRRGATKGARRKGPAARGREPGTGAPTESAAEPLLGDADPQGTDGFRVVEAFIGPAVL